MHSAFKPLPGGWATEKRLKNSKKILKNSKKIPKNTMYENPGGHAPLPPAADAPGFNQLSS